MGHPIEERSCHLGIAEYARPFAEARIDVYYNDGEFVKHPWLMLQQGLADLVELQIPQVREDGQVKLKQKFFKLAILTLDPFLFERIEAVVG